MLALVTGAVVASVAIAGEVGAAVPGLTVFAVIFTGRVDPASCSNPDGASRPG